MLPAKRKAWFVVLLVVAVLVSVSLLPLADATAEASVMESHDRISELSQLLDRAKLGVDDARGVGPQATWREVGLTGAVGLVEAQVLSTTQLLEKIALGNGQVRSSYTTTAFLVNGGGSKTQRTPDSSGSVKAFATISWETFTTGNQSCTNLVGEVCGGWDVQQSGVTVSDWNVRVGQTGITQKLAPVRCSIEYRPTTSAFSYQVPEDWGSVVTGASGYRVSHKLGVVTSATIRHGTDSWSLELVVQESA